MKAVSVDPRDVQVHTTASVWRVYFVERRAGGASDEFRLTGAPDVRAVLQWADARAGDREALVYLEIDRPGERTLILVAGTEHE
jgi:hypothetical protein